MKKKMYSVILMVFGLLFSLTACGETKEDGSREVVEPESVTQEQDVTEEVKKQYEAIENDTMLSSLVHLKAETGEKSISAAGFIMEIAEDRVYICTNGHVIQNYPDWQIYLYDGTQVIGGNLGISAVYDVGVVTVEIDQLPEGFENKYRPVNINVDKWKAMLEDGTQCPIQVYRVGENGLNEECLEGVVMNFYADFKWGNQLKHTEMDISLQEGDSGSAILDKDGYLVSMAYGVSQEEGKPKRWGIPLASVLTCYQEITGREYVNVLE